MLVHAGLTTNDNIRFAIIIQERCKFPFFLVFLERTKVPTRSTAENSYLNNFTLH